MSIIKSYNLSFILIAITLGILGSYLAICLCEQLRCSYLHGEKNNLFIRIKWLLCIGMSLGGVGMWCMHYIGMSAISLKDSLTGEEISIGYNPAISFFTLGLIIFIISLGVGVASNDRMFAKSKAEILEMFIQDSHHLSMVEIRKIKDSKIIFLISTKKLWTLIGGGFVAGAGFCVANYIGMASWEFEDSIKVSFQPGLVVASLLIALFSATFAFWVLFRLLSIFPSIESLRTCSAIIMGIAVCGVHFLGMESAEFNYSSHGRKFTPNHLPENNLVAILLASFILLWILAVVIFIDLRKVNLKYRNLIIFQVRKTGGDSRKALDGSIMEQVWKEVSVLKFKSSMHSVDNSNIPTTFRIKPMRADLALSPRSSHSPRKKTYVIKEDPEEDSMKPVLDQNISQIFDQTLKQENDLEEGLDPNTLDISQSTTQRLT